MRILHLWCELDWNKISKNRQHKIAGNKLINTNTPFMTKLIEEISIESKLQKIKWQNVKTWIEIMVYKSSQKGDAINVIDVIADCCKKGIGIDDCFFSAKIDWQYCDKAQEKIDITIKQ